MSYTPDSAAFKKIFEEGKTQIVLHWIPADLETPVSAYMKLANEQANSFLLESVEGGKTLGRYSIIGLEPDKIWTCQDDTVTLDGERTDADPINSLRALLTECAIDTMPEKTPPMAASGLFGMMGYDMVRLVESIPDNNPDELNIPDAVMIRPTVMVIFDNVRSEICLAAPIYHTADNSDQSADDIYGEAIEKLSMVESKLALPIPQSVLKQRTQLSNIEVSSNMTREYFHGMVKKAVEYIHAGDIFQVVPSQRFSFDFDLPAFQLYRSLRRLNPSPFLFYFNFGGFHLVGSSPEVLVRVRDKKVTIRPIAGTRKRGQDEAEDKALSQDLLSDPKERSEHLMLLDLGRNDVGRVAQTGSVQVTDQFIIEYYSHVMHIVSNVEGILKDTVDALDALFAGFPAGTVSGAPKIRAMEIIDELEPVKRKFYAGCVGYLAGNGEMDTCIALRTALVKDGKAYVQAGGGVVADSDPEFEYQESCNKARAIIQAAEEALDHTRYQ
jgi:anthranilate synthase component 1